MPNNNVPGKNQLGEHPYGEVKKMQQLTAAAPMSGAPTASGALDAARRAQRTAVAGRTGTPAVAAASPPAAPNGPGPLPAALPQHVGDAGAAQRARVWADLAGTPGASDLVKAYAQQAQQEAQVG